MRILRWMSGSTIRDRMRNKCIHRKLEVTHIKMRGYGLGMCDADY